MKIRKAIMADFEKMYKIMKKEYLKHYKEKWTKENSFRTFDYFSKIGTIYVILDDNKVKGFIVMRKEYYNGKYNMFIEELVVDGDFQGKGWGRSLVSYVESLCKKQKIKFISLGASKKARAFGFYKKLGYNPSKNFVVMEKELK